MRQLRSSIRKSRDSDIEAILEWLKDEEEKGFHGNFLCNWELTKKAHDEGGLIVYFSAQENAPVAYQCGALLVPGILQVKHDYRGRGIGRKLVHYLMNKARNQNNEILRIECVPSSSIPFWEKMGFTILDDNVNAFQIIPRALELPSHYAEVSLVVRFYPESIMWCESASPLESHYVSGYEIDGGVIRLSDRLHFYPYQYGEIRDPVVEIIKDGVSLYRDKLKYPQTADLGALNCKNGWFFDFINK